MSNPFTLPTTQLESAWSAKDHQQAANFYWYEMQGYNENAFQRGECGANYMPMFQMMRAAYLRHTQRARTLRISISAEPVAI